MGAIAGGNSFEDVRPKYMALMGELYGKFAGYIPYYFDNSFMFVTISVYNEYIDTDREPTLGDAEPSMFSCTWALGENATEVVAKGFIEYVHALGKGLDIPSEQCEHATLSYVMESTMSYESVVSNVFQDLNASAISVPDRQKLILPKH